MATDLRLVLSTCPPDRAASLAGELVGERLAACCNILPGLESVYWWEGAVQRDAESLLLFKVSADRLEALTSRLVELHPYDVPEVLALPVEAGFEPYLAWARRACDPA